MKVVELSKNKEKKDWKLYVLRYNYSGNYYVGTTEDFENRMLDHWRKTSEKKNLPIWSKRNKSKKGFKFFWFNIEKSGVSQSYAEHCEWKLAKMIFKEIKKINHKKLAEEIHVGNWKLVDCKKYNSKFEPNVSFDEKIEKYLKELKKIETKDGKFQIECYAIGYIGEYDNSQCNKSWEEVASIRFLSDKK